MKTLTIVDGDIFTDPATGSWVYVDNINKGAQDVARHLLCEFDAFFDEGNELITLTVDATAFGLSESIASQFIYAAMNRLIMKQRLSEDGERILKVNQLRTRVVGLSTIVFMVEVLFTSGDIQSVTDSIILKPVQLNQLLNPSTLISPTLTGNGISNP